MRRRCAPYPIVFCARFCAEHRLASTTVRAVHALLTIRSRSLSANAVLQRRQIQQARADRIQTGFPAQSQSPNVRSAWLRAKPTPPSRDTSRQKRLAESSLKEESFVRHRRMPITISEPSRHLRTISGRTSGGFCISTSISTIRLPCAWSRPALGAASFAKLRDQEIARTRGSSACAANSATRVRSLRTSSTKTIFPTFTARGLVRDGLYPCNKERDAVLVIFLPAQ